MTRQEKLIRAREACAAEWPALAQDFRTKQLEDSAGMKAALRALNDLDKPIPDADEAWRPFLEALGYPVPNPFGEFERQRIAAFKAARHLMPPEERS